jgi:hypothetical protein
MRVETRRSKRHNAASIVPNNTSLVQSGSCRWQPKRWISIVCSVGMGEEELTPALPQRSIVTRYTLHVGN